MKQITYGGLFEGVGMFAYAAKKAGLQLTWSNENDNWCCDILNKNFDHKIINEDVRTIGVKNGLKPTNVICGGFPCQDISICGLGEGINGKRSNLWYEYYRIIKETSPKFVVIENSPQLLKRGFEQILYDFSKIGYDVEWECISAAEYGCDHIRERLWIIAYPSVQGRKGILYMLKRSLIEKNKKTNALDTQRNPFLQFTERYSEPAVFGMDDANAKELDAIKRLGGIGNSIIWEIAYDILKIIVGVIENEKL